MPRSKLRACAIVVSTAALVTSITAAAGAVGVSPVEVSQDASPGDVITLTKEVGTPEVPPKPDVVLLVDRTGSMGSAISNVKANIATVVAEVKASQPDAQFAVVQYCDFDDPDPAFNVLQDLTGDDVAVTAAVNSIVLCNGGDSAEAQLNALWEIGSGGNAIDFRPDSSRIVAWFGDAPGKDPSGGHTEADAIAALQNVGARVLAVSVGQDRLDITGQATRITNATGGSLLTGVATSEVATKILEGLTNLKVTVTGTPTCDPGLAISLTPASQTVTSGDTAVFEETITVADPPLPQGTLTCSVAFTLNGVAAGPEFVQTVAINLNDVTPPVVACSPGPNPAGNEPSATNEDGYFRMLATDTVDPSVDIYVTDTASDAEFGPYPTGTTFKLTQAPGGKVDVKPFTGEVTSRFMLNGDAELIAFDDSGNTATALCEVAPKG